MIQLVKLQKNTMDKNYVLRHYVEQMVIGFDLLSHLNFLNGGEAPQEWSTMSLASETM